MRTKTQYARILDGLTTHDAHGRHFMRMHPESVISALVREGLIEISHPDIGQDFNDWWVRVTDRGRALVASVAARQVANSIDDADTDFDTDFDSDEDY